MQGLLDKPQALFALVLSPTRELAIQIAEQFEALGSDIGVRCAVLVGGIDMMAQAIALGKRPHIIVGTPGRVVDHLSNTKVPLAAALLMASLSYPAPVFFPPHGRTPMAASHWPPELVGDAEHRHCALLVGSVS